MFKSLLLFIFIILESDGHLRVGRDLHQLLHLQLRVNKVAVLAVHRSALHHAAALLLELAGLAVAALLLQPAKEKFTSCQSGLNVYNVTSSCPPL